MKELVRAWPIRRVQYSALQTNSLSYYEFTLIYDIIPRNRPSIIVCSSIADVDSGLRSSSGSSSSKNNNNNSDIGMDNVSIVHKFDWAKNCPYSDVDSAVASR